jgi:hypothetical protein
MRMMAAAILVTLTIAGAAHACPPPPPPPAQMEGESEFDYVIRLQTLREEEAAASLARRVEFEQQWWNESESVFLARIERAETIEFDGYYETVPRVHLRPLRWIKGSGSSRRFRLSYEGMTSCGPYGGGEAVEGAVGDVFLVFVREGRPRQRSVIHSLALTNVHNPDLRARLPEVQ